MNELKCRNPNCVSDIKAKLRGFYGNVSYRFSRIATKGQTYARRHHTLLLVTSNKQITEKLQIQKPLITPLSFRSPASSLRRISQLKKYIFMYAQLSPNVVKANHIMPRHIRSPAPKDLCFLSHSRCAYRFTLYKQTNPSIIIFFATKVFLATENISLETRVVLFLYMI